MTTETVVNRRIYRRGLIRIVVFLALGCQLVAGNALRFYSALSDGDDSNIRPMVIGGFIGLFFLGVACHFLGVLVCDERGLTYRNIGFSKRILFNDVTLSVFRPEEQELILYSPETSITCNGKYRHFDELCAFVDAHLPGGLQEGDWVAHGETRQRADTCRYPSDPGTRLLIVGVGVLVLPLAISFFLEPRLDPSGDFAEDWLRLLSIVSAYVLFSTWRLWGTSTQLTISDNGIVQRTLLRQRHVAFNEIDRVERHIAFNGEEQLAIHHQGGILRCRAAMEGYSTFVERLDFCMAVSWRDETALALPITVNADSPSLRHVQLACIAFGVSAVAAFWGIPHFVREISEEGWAGVLAAVLFSLLFGACGTALVAEGWNPKRRYVFHRSQFEIHSRREMRIVDASAVRDITLTDESNKNLVGRTSAIRKLRIHLADEDFEIESGRTRTPLEPLYGKLRAVYLGGGSAENGAGEADVSDRPD